MFPNYFQDAYSQGNFSPSINFKFLSQKTFATKSVKNNDLKKNNFLIKQNKKKKTKRFVFGRDRILYDHYRHDKKVKELHIQTL